MNLKVISPPEEEPITLERAQKELRTDEDISDLIVAAREYCESYQNKRYITQTLELNLESFPVEREIEFRDCSPVQSVSSVKYYDADDIEYILPNTDYIVDTNSFISRIVLRNDKSWPDIILRPVNGVVIQFVAGYGNAAAPDQA